MYIDLTQLDEIICIYQCEMKRLIYLSVTDFLLLYKTGILWLYVGLTALYILIYHHLPPSMIRPVSSVLIFSDPSASGLYFMGAVILLEKSQKVSFYLSITPVKAVEYMTSKYLLSVPFHSVPG